MPITRRFNSFGYGERSRKFASKVPTEKINGWRGSLSFIGFAVALADA
jgi:hypothetical protein